MIKSQTLQVGHENQIMIKNESNSESKPIKFMIKIRMEEYYEDALRESSILRRTWYYARGGNSPRM